MCLYLFSASLAFEIRRLSSVSNLKDTTKASGTHKLTRGAKIFGTNWRDIVGGPVEGILWTAWKNHLYICTSMFIFIYFLVENLIKKYIPIH